MSWLCLQKQSSEHGMLSQQNMVGMACVWMSKTHPTWGITRFASTGLIISNGYANAMATLRDTTAVGASMAIIWTKVQHERYNCKENYSDTQWCTVQGLHWDLEHDYRTYPSGYVAVLNQSLPGSTNIEMAPVILYQLFIWLHHFAAKDSECEEGKFTSSYWGSSYNLFTKTRSGLGLDWVYTISGLD